MRALSIAMLQHCGAIKKVYMFSLSLTRYYYSYPFSQHSIIYSTTKPVKEMHFDVLSNKVFFFWVYIVGEHSEVSSA